MFPSFSFLFSSFAVCVHEVASAATTQPPHQHIPHASARHRSPHPHHTAQPRAAHHCTAQRGTARPTRPCSLENMCMEPPWPRQQPVFLPKSSAITCQVEGGGVLVLGVRGVSRWAVLPHPALAKAQVAWNTVACRARRCQGRHAPSPPRQPPRASTSSPAGTGAVGSSAHLARGQALGQRVHVVAVGGAHEVVLLQQPDHTWGGGGWVGRGGGEWVKESVL